MICPNCSLSVAVWRQVRKWERKFGQDKNVLKTLAGFVAFDIICPNCKKPAFGLEIDSDPTSAADESEDEKPKKKTSKR